ncbi:hypothetical protein ACJZ2D_017199 [Fusarium nematophilum]
MPSSEVIPNTFAKTSTTEQSQQKGPRFVDEGLPSRRFGEDWETTQTRWEEPNEVDQERRMRTYIELRSATSWDETKSILASIRDIFYFGLAVNDIPEVYRDRTVSHLNAWRAKAITEIITMIQLNKHKYDPDSVFPIVATEEFKKTLPAEAERCVVCYTAFETLGYETIIWKACGKHVMHSYCLRDLLEANENPIYGPCGCNTAGYEDWELKMPSTGCRKKKSMIRHYGAHHWKKLSRPIYWNLQI